MTIRLYIDEDAMHAGLVQALRARGVDITTVAEQAKAGHSDEQQLEFAASQGRAIYSFNVKDYLLLHARFLERGVTHSGIILAAQDSFSVGEQMRRILRLIAERTAEEMQNQCVFLSSLRDS